MKPDMSDLGTRGRGGESTLAPPRAMSLPSATSAADVASGHGPVGRGRRERAAHCEHGRKRGLLDGDRGARERHISDVLGPIRVWTTGRAWDRRHRLRGLYVERRGAVLEFGLRDFLGAR